jgi:hypothetical protein
MRNSETTQLNGTQPAAASTLAQNDTHANDPESLWSLLI